MPTISKFLIKWKSNMQKNWKMSGNPSDLNYKQYWSIGCNISWFKLPLNIAVKTKMEENFYQLITTDLNPVDFMRYLARNPLKSVIIAWITLFSWWKRTIVRCWKLVMQIIIIILNPPVIVGIEKAVL